MTYGMGRDGMGKHVFKEAKGTQKRTKAVALLKNALHWPDTACFRHNYISLLKLEHPVRTRLHTNQWTKVKWVVLLRCLHRLFQEAIKTNGIRVLIQSTRLAQDNTF